MTGAPNKEANLVLIFMTCVEFIFIMVSTCLCPYVLFQNDSSYKKQLGFSRLPVSLVMVFITAMVTVYLFISIIYTRLS